MQKNVVQQNSCTFALRVVQLAKYLQGEKREFGLSKQVVSVAVLIRR